MDKDQKEAVMASEIELYSWQLSVDANLLVCKHDLMNLMLLLGKG